MSDFKAQPLFKQIEDGLKGMDDKEKKDIQKKVSMQRETVYGATAADPAILLSPDQRRL